MKPPRETSGWLFYWHLHLLILHRHHRNSQLGILLIPILLTFHRHYRNSQVGFYWHLFIFMLHRHHRAGLNSDNPLVYILEASISNLGLFIHLNNWVLLPILYFFLVERWEYLDVARTLSFRSLPAQHLHSSYNLIQRQVITAVEKITRCSKKQSRGMLA
jgi:hypothetical protein